MESLIPYARNARTHSDAQVAQIAASIREFGFCNPVLIDAESGIIAGHGRVLAARKLGMTDVPCVRLGHLTDVQRRAYIIADNKLALNAGWDEAMLALELSALRIEEFDLDLTGFDVGEIDALLDGADLVGSDGGGSGEDDTEPEVDRADELRKLWGVETGQLWQLGEHRLLCGDSTRAEDVARVMGGERADLCFTSPPYGQQREYRDGGAVTDWDELMRGVFGNLPMADDGQVLVNLGLVHDDGECIQYWANWLDWMRSIGYRHFGWYVWDQIRGLPGDWNGRLAPSHEFVFHFNKKSVQPVKHVECNQERAKKERDSVSKGNSKLGLRGKDGIVRELSSLDSVGQTHKVPDSVLRFERHMANDVARKGHPATFPVTLPEFAQKSWPGICFEPFSGSGTTIIAGENLNRRVRAIEISPAYVAVALQRWADHTGGTPVLVSA